MHIMEGFLPPLHAAAWTAVAAPFVVAGARQVIKTTRDNPGARLTIAASGAFVFVLSALKMPSVTGSCSHPTGTGLGAVAFGPSIMAALGAIVLVFQALLLAHGGLTTLGANVFAMAVVGPWVAYGVYRAAGRLGLGSSLAIFLAAMLGDLATYVTTATQLALAFPDPAGGFGGSLVKFMGIFAVTQIPLAAVEGLLTVAAINALTRHGLLGAREVTS